MVISYFTFGFDHVDPASGERLDGKYVAVHAETHEAARDRFVQQYGTAWAFQYPEADGPRGAGVEKYGLVLHESIVVASPHPMSGLTEVTRGSPILLTDAKAEAKIVEEKQARLGGTDIAAALGLSEWRSPFDLWARLKGLVPEREDTERFEMGRLMEPIVLAKYARQMDVELGPAPGLITHPRYPWFGGHPDGITADMMRVPDAKTIETHAGRPGDGRWSQPTDAAVRVPDDYFWQLVGYMALVPEAAFFDIAAQFGFSRFVVYSFPTDPVLVERLLARLAAWWEKHIVGNEPPPVTATDTSKAVRARLFPAHTTDEIRSTTLEEEEVLYALRNAERRYQTAEQEYEDLRERVRFLIGAGRGIEGDWGRAVNPKQKDSTKQVTDWEAIVRASGMEVEAEVIAAHTKTVVTKEGGRVLRVTWKGE